ncbi:hypothetical protein D9M69_679340 [compost metagenome]
MGVQAIAAQAFGLRLAGGGVQVGQHYQGAFLQQALGGGQADAVGRAGHQADALVQSFHLVAPYQPCRLACMAAVKGSM